MVGTRGIEPLSMSRKPLFKPNKIGQSMFYDSLMTILLKSTRGAAIARMTDDFNKISYEVLLRYKTSSCNLETDVLI